MGKGVHTKINHTFRSLNVDYVEWIPSKLQNTEKAKYGEKEVIL